MQRPQVGREEGDVNGCPTTGAQVLEGERKVCGEAGGRSAKLGEKEPALGLPQEQSPEARHCVFVESLTSSSQSLGPCLPAGASGSQTQPRAFTVALEGRPTGLCRLAPRTLRVLLSFLELDALLGRGLASEGFPESPRLSLRTPRSGPFS